jgi:hypothetical protein
METTIRINTDMLNMEILEGIQKMFPHKKVEITIQETYDEFAEDGGVYIEGDEDATQFILNRPAFAAELRRRIDSIENKTAKLVTVNPQDLLCD